MKILVIVIGLIACVACEHTSPNSVEKRTFDEHAKSTGESTIQSTPSAPRAVKQTSSSFHAKYYYSDSLGWGYDILKDKSVLIHQPHIPAVQGNQGFRSEYDAEKAANRVIEKLDHNIMPPTLSIDELRELGVL